MQPLSDEAIDRLQKLGGQSFVNRMIDLFLGFSREKVREADAASQAGEFEAASRAAHALKSSAGNVGAVRVQRIAVDIEERVRQGHTEGTAEMVKELQKAVEEVIPLLEACKRSVDTADGPGA